MKRYIIIFLIILILLSYTTSLIDTKQSVQKETLQEDQKTTIEQTVLPSGETHTTTTIVYKKQLQKELIKSKEKTWYITVGRSINPVYQFSVNKQIYKDFTIGIYGNTKNEYGLQLGYTF